MYNIDNLLSIFAEKGLRFFRDFARKKRLPRGSEQFRKPSGRMEMEKPTRFRSRQSAAGLEPLGLDR